MPVIPWKNLFYQWTLPIFGLHIPGDIACDMPIPEHKLHKLKKIFRRQCVVGATLQIIRHGELGPLVTYGFSRLPDKQAARDTIYRTASITKLVTALGAMRLIEQGMLDLDADIGDLLGYAVRNPHYPDQAITLRHLLSHSSGICDGPMYEKALTEAIPLTQLLEDTQNYVDTPPGKTFLYSNLAAGMVGSIMECATGKSLEALMQELVFRPLDVQAAYSLKNLQDLSRVAHIYRVLPNRKEPQFHVEERYQKADPMSSPDPQFHYRWASGNLFTDAVSLGKILCALCRGGEPIVTKESLRFMGTPLVSYGTAAPHMQHGLGMAIIDDPTLYHGKLYGHQGSAYGAMEGIFYDPETGNGIAFLDNGASEARGDHLAQVNREVITWALSQGDQASWM